MDDAKFSVGADVMPLGGGGRGRVIERRQVDDGKVVYGVLTNNGHVNYYTGDGLRSAVGML